MDFSAEQTSLFCSGWGVGVGLSTGRSRFGAVGLSLCAAFALSGCVAAAIPIMLAATVGATALEGFALYKTVQTSSGGSIKVAFPGKDGKETLPQPLPIIRKVAVWPGDEGDVHFADRLAKSGRFDVIPPSTVSVALANENVTSNLRLLTEDEEIKAFAVACRDTKVEFIFASRSLGASSDTSVFSFSRANVTYKAELLGFSCDQNAIVWRDQIALIVEIGAKIPSDAEINAAASDAWADRILEAPST